MDYVIAIVLPVVASAVTLMALAVLLRAQGAERRPGVRDIRGEFDGGADVRRMNDRGAILATRLGVTDLRDAIVAAKKRGVKGAGMVVVEGGKFNVVKTTFYRKKCVDVEVLGGPFTRVEVVKFLEAL